MTIIEPVLSQMPWNVKRDIVELADTLTKFSLRRCSKEYKEHVDKSIIAYKRLLVWYHPRINSVTVALNVDDDITFSLEFHQLPVGYRSIQKPLTDDEHENEVGKTVLTGNFIEAALTQTVKIFRNQKVSLKQLDIEMWSWWPKPELPEFLNNQTTLLAGLCDALTSRGHNLLAEEFRFHHTGDLQDCRPLLSLVQPGYLKRIMLSYHSHGYDLFVLHHEVLLDQIAEMEQWKRATALNIHLFKLTLPLEKWSHFSELSFHLEEVTVDKVRELYYTFLSNPNFKKCELNCEAYDNQSIAEYFVTLNPKITAIRRVYAEDIWHSGKVELKINIPDIPDTWFRISLIEMPMHRVIEFSKVGKDYQEPEEEEEEEKCTVETIKITAAELLANFGKYVCKVA